MKAIKTFLFLFAIILLTACSSTSNPTKLAEKFATAYLNADYDKCNKMMEEEEFTPSSEMSKFEKEAVKAMKEEAKKKKYVLTIDEDSSDIDEDSATIYFDITSKTDPEFKETIRVNIEKDDNNKWVVDGFKQL
ncbi:hypothetical protein [Bacteroides sp. 224]|uniref:hypothetical protein n=1 Tax=Bacteroides sp. 224 TaxID=2302936 RepID=UPI0013D116A0|nr:hypothetical protein [Bacteroides sp. 224]NDV65379.1 hypothetical protein [Bacteroides sp. 224]